MNLLRRAVSHRAALLTLVGAVVVVVALATGTLRRIDTGGVAATTTAISANLVLAPQVPNPAAYTQVDAYSHGYRCVRASLPGATTAQPSARRAERAVAACDRRAKRDRVGNASWYRTGAADAKRDLLGQATERAACLLNFGCGAAHATIRYFRYIQEGMRP
jgi:hypothetical protein